MTAAFRPDSPDDFFHWRRDWFRLDLMQNRHGGWCVVLVLDEGYGQREDAERLSDFFAEKLAKALVDVFNRDPDHPMWRNRSRDWFGGSAEILEQAYRAQDESATA